MANKKVTPKKRVRSNAKQAVIVEQDYSEEALRAVLNAANDAVSRTGLASRLGMQFEGERDLYATFGYKTNLSYDDYRAFYDRLGMATRVVEKFSDDTWNKPPVLVDGESRSDGIGTSETPFITEFNALAKKLQLWQVMRQADIMCGIGRYSLLFLGASGDFARPAPNGQLFYISAYDEKQAEIGKYVKDKKKESYGLPETYKVSMENLEEFGGINTRAVHYSRVIHISENRLGSRVFGRPRMQEVYNRLTDLEKVTGGGAEAAWLAVYMGFLLLTREGTEFPAEDSQEWKSADEAIQRFAHRMQRFATLRGVERVENLGVHEVRIKDIYEVLIGDLAGSKGIPQRILLGSERGNLASSQDMQEWNGVIKGRRTNFAEPEMIDPFVDYCIKHEVIPAPQSGSYTTEWLPVYTPTQVEEADYALKVGQGAYQVTGGVPEEAIDVDEWRALLHFPPRNLRELVRKEIAKIKAEQTIEEKTGVPVTDPTIDKKSPTDTGNPTELPTGSNGSAPIGGGVNGKKKAKVAA